MCPRRETGFLLRAVATRQKNERLPLLFAGFHPGPQAKRAASGCRRGGRGSRRLVRPNASERGQGLDSQHVCLLCVAGTNSVYSIAFASPYRSCVPH